MIMWPINSLWPICNAANINVANKDSLRYNSLFVNNWNKLKIVGFVADRWAYNAYKNYTKSEIQHCCFGMNYRVFRNLLTSFN